MYSLGIMFFEMWAGFKTRFERDRAINLLKQKHFIGAEYEKLMPQKAIEVIKLLVRNSPDERPTALNLL